MKLLGNILWWVFGGLTVIGIPFGKQHFKMAGLSLAPFGKEVELHF